MSKISDQSMESESRWFIKVEGVRLGPYSSGSIRRRLANAELSLNAEISKDSKSWLKVHQVSEVMPLKLRAQMGDRTAQKLVHARRLAEQQAESNHGRAFPLSALLVITLLIGGVLGVAFWRGQPGEVDDPDCSSLPAPGVNWRNCILPGIDVGAASLTGADLDSAKLSQAKLMATDLRSANLRYSDLSGADLSYAQLEGAVLMGANLRSADLLEADLTHADLRFTDLTGSRLNRAQLQGARLDEAIWTDGKPCKVGSVGRCVR